MNPFRPERNEWTGKEPLEKIRSAPLMRSHWNLEKTNDSSPRNKKCKFKRPKIDRPPRNPEISTKNTSKTSKRKIVN